MAFKPGLFTAAAALCLRVAAQDAAAPPAAGEAVEFKLTPTYMHASDGNHARDLNLRFGRGAHVGWIGDYRDRAGFHQMRTGYEYRMDLGWSRLVLSAQYAQGGFFGASVSGEFGGDSYVIAGIDRNNLRDYYNLNFDPNNAVVLGLGTRAIDRTELSLFQVHDYRLNNAQQTTHAVMRWRPAPKQRLTVDFSYKSGQASTGNRVSGTGLSVAYDYEDYFVRITRDPYANFSAASQTRFVAGLRF